jgi:hypothetical protein
MLEPDMATMLAYVFTDADLSPAALDAALRGAVDRTFNCLSVDTDTSTSDTAAVIANGAAGPVDQAEFSAALADLCLDLTEQLASDGEGATKLLRVTVGGARDSAQAKRIAKSVVNSPLVKTAVHGADPNWGRILMAIRYLLTPYTTGDRLKKPSKPRLTCDYYQTETWRRGLRREVGGESLRSRGLWGGSTAGGPYAGRQSGAGWPPPRSGPTGPPDLLPEGPRRSRDLKVS